MTQLQQQQFDSKKKKKKVKHVQTVNSEHNSWRPRAATRLQDHVVLLTSQRDGTYTASVLRKQLRIASSLNVSDRTICNGLHEANISCRRPSVRPFVTQANRPACLAWVLLLSIPFLYFFKNLVLINRRNGPRYQRVLALCAFSTWVILKGLILWKFCVRCFGIFCLCKFVSGLILWFLDNLWFDDLRAG